jgi:hypothetical protein
MKKMKKMKRTPSVPAFLTPVEALASLIGFTLAFLGEWLLAAAAFAVTAVVAVIQFIWCWIALRKIRRLLL